MAGLMDYFTSGAQAMAAPAEARANIQKAQLQQQYAPQAMQDQEVQRQQTIAVNALKIQQLQDTVSGETAAMPEEKAYLADPKNASKQPSEQMKDLGTIMMKHGLLSQGTALLQKSSLSQQEEAKAQADQKTIQEGKLEKMQIIAKNMDPNDPNSVNQGLLQITQLGGNPNLFRNQQAQFGTKAAIDMAIERSKTAKDLIEERKAQDSKIREEQSNHRMELETNRINLEIARMVSSDNRRNSTDSKKEKADNAKLLMEYNKDTRNLHDKYLTNYRKAPDVDSKQALTDQYENNLSALNKDYAPLLSAHGINPEEAPKVTPKAKTAAKVAIPFPSSVLDWVAKVATSTQDPTNGIPADAINQLKANPETTDKFDEVFGKGSAARVLTKREVSGKIK